MSKEDVVPLAKDGKFTSKRHAALQVNGATQKEISGNEYNRMPDQAGGRGKNSRRGKKRGPKHNACQPRRYFLRRSIEESA